MHGAATRTDGKMTAQILGVEFDDGRIKRYPAPDPPDSRPDLLSTAGSDSSNQIRRPHVSV
jgi:hypothetical protein